MWDILKLKVSEDQQSFVGFPMNPKNKVAQDLYRSFGFVETGEKDGEEVIAVLKLVS